MANEYGESSSIEVTMDGPFGNTGSSIKTVEIQLSLAGWKNGESPYYQTVTLDGVSTKSKVDLQPTHEQIAVLGATGTALTVANEAGTITVYAVGGKPASDLLLLATITEVFGGGVIWGGMVGASTAPLIAGLKTAKETADGAVKRSGGTMTGPLNLPAPTQNAHAVNKGYVDTKAVTITLLDNGWTGDTAPYTQSVEIDGLTDEKFAKAYPAWPEALEDKLALSEETAKVRSASRSGSTMTFECWEEKPTLDIPVVVEVYV